MVDADVIARRVLALNECLSELSRPEAADATALARDRLLRAAVERWLQVAIEACIDIATHVVAAEGWTPAGSAREAFLVLANHGKLPLELAQRLAAVAGVRNVLVHDYVAVDLGRIAYAVKHDLADLRELAALVEPWMEEGDA
jgi:uncharacterized protein YutE (UPF0331/DUF86 family)